MASSRIGLVGNLTLIGLGRIVLLGMDALYEIGPDSRAVLNLTQKRRIQKFKSFD
jgi:hypothetical protein